MISVKEAKAMIASVPKTQLGFFPTPFYRLNRLSDMFGVNMWIKRDDFTGSNLFGGNKTRKLEFLIGKALAEGAECVITYGATQSNHAMQTIWAATKNGIRPVVYLAAVVPPDSSDIRANLLLDRLFEAEIHIVDLKEGENFEQAEYRSFEMGKEHIARLEAEGTKCSEIPMGGANECGSLGYLNAMIELAEQMEAEEIGFEHLYHSSGSGGTAAGIMAGRRLMGLDMKVHSVTAMDVGDGNGYAKRAAELANGALKLIGSSDTVDASEFIIDQNHYAPGYECPSKDATEAIRLLAKNEGILTDPVYSGKAFAGMLHDIRSGAVAQGSNVLFVHTGGATALFAEKEILGNLI